MKAFVLLVLLILVFVFLSVTGIAQTDLTPGTTAMEVQNFAPEEPQVIAIQSDTPGLADVPENSIVPLTGSPACTDPYTVRQGDYLSGIASLCGTTIGVIRQANPQITNINLIYPGMQIRIPGAASPQNPIPSTGSGKDTFIFPTETPAVDPLDLVEPTPTPNRDTTAVFPAGMQMTVRAINLPPVTPLTIAIGPLGGEYQVVGTGVTDTQGNFTGSVIVPDPAEASVLPHVVVISTTVEPISQTISPPFFISPPAP